MEVNKSVIAHKKAIYGDNFLEWANIVRELLGVDFDGVQMATIGYALKLSRKKAVTKVLNRELSVALINRDDEKIKELKKALDDTEQDLANYKWISENYLEYKEL
jgi:hypothetical protein